MDHKRVTFGDATSKPSGAEQIPCSFIMLRNTLPTAESDRVSDQISFAENGMSGLNGIALHPVRYWVGACTAPMMEMPRLAATSLQIASVVRASYFTFRKTVSFPKTWSITYRKLVPDR